MTATALVFGCNGFCGQPLASLMQDEADTRVIGADVQTSAVLDIEAYHEVDVTDWNAVAEIITRIAPDWVFNFAGVATGDLRQQLAVNLMGAMHILESVRERSPRTRVVLVGSAAEYGMVLPDQNPLTEDRLCLPVGPYAVSKHAMTVAALAHAREHGTGVLIMRPFNIVGPGVPNHLVLGAVIERAIEALNQGGQPVVKVGNLDARRDFISIKDAARSFLLAAQSDLSGEVINICSGIPLTVREVVERTLSYAPRTVELEVDPGLFRAIDVPVVYGNPAKGLQMLGFECSSVWPSLEAAWKARANSADANGSIGS